MTQFENHETTRASRDGLICVSKCQSRTCRVDTQRRSSCGPNRNFGSDRLKFIGSMSSFFWLRSPKIYRVHALIFGSDRQSIADPCPRFFGSDRLKSTPGSMTCPHFRLRSPENYRIHALVKSLANFLSGSCPRKR